MVQLRGLARSGDAATCSSCGGHRSPPGLKTTARGDCGQLRARKSLQLRVRRTGSSALADSARVLHGAVCSSALTDSANRRSALADGACCLHSANGNTCAAGRLRLLLLLLLLHRTRLRHHLLPLRRLRIPPNVAALAGVEALAGRVGRTHHPHCVFIALSTHRPSLAVGVLVGARCLV
jgi:hypothetical protein